MTQGCVCTIYDTDTYVGEDGYRSHLRPDRRPGITIGTEAISSAHRSHCLPAEADPSSRNSDPLWGTVGRTIALRIILLLRNNRSYCVAGSNCICSAYSARCRQKVCSFWSSSVSSLKIAQNQIHTPARLDIKVGVWSLVVAGNV